MRRKRFSDSKQSRETSSEGFASTCSVLAVGLFVLTFVFQNFVIPSSSMASTLLVGDHVVVEREALAPAPKVGALHALPRGASWGHCRLLQTNRGTQWQTHICRQACYRNSRRPHSSTQRHRLPQRCRSKRASSGQAYNRRTMTPTLTISPPWTPLPSLGLRRNGPILMHNHIQGQDLVVPSRQLFRNG